MWRLSILLAIHWTKFSLNVFDAAVLPREVVSLRPGKRMVMRGGEGRWEGEEGFGGDAPFPAGLEGKARVCGAGLPPSPFSLACT